MQQEQLKLIEVQHRIADSEAGIVKLRHDRHERSLQMELELAEELSAARDIELKRNQWQCTIQEIEAEHAKMQADAAARALRNEHYLGELAEAHNAEAALIEAQIDGKCATP